MDSYDGERGGSLSLGGRWGQTLGEVSRSYGYGLCHAPTRDSVRERERERGEREKEEREDDMLAAG